MARRKRIAYVSLFYPPLGGGAEIYLERMIGALARFDQHLWTLGHENRNAVRRAAGACSITYFGEGPRIDYDTLGAWFDEHREEIFDSIRRWAERTAPDLVLLNSPITFFGPIRELVRELRLDRPVGSIQHDVPGPSFSILLDSFKETGSWQESLGLAQPDLLRLAKSATPPLSASPFHLGTDFTIYNSAWVRGFLDPREERQGFVLHPLVERTDDRPALGLAPVDLTIVNPLPMKGGALFLALANYHFRGRRIRILGGGYNSAMARLEPFLREVESGFYRGKIPANIEVLGRVENMTEVYRNTTVLLHPTRIEGYGLTSVEALLENCLVATTDLPGVVEGVRDAALRLPYFATPQEWADGISKMIESRDDWQEATARRASRLLSRQAEEIAALEEFLGGLDG